MKATPTRIPDVLLIEPKVFGDDRGFFFESFNRRAFHDQATECLQASHRESPMLAVLMLVRFVFWKPQLAMRRIDLGIMYLGYLAIATQLVLKFLDQTIEPGWVGTVSIHVFALGAMGLVIPAMIVRIAKGHTGRKVAFDSLDKWVLRIMILGLIVRTVATQIHPAWYLHWIHLAATCWFVGFAILAWRYVPFLMQARIDGKEH